MAPSRPSRSNGTDADECSAGCTVERQYDAAVTTKGLDVSRQTDQRHHALNCTDVPGGSQCDQNGEIRLDWTVQDIGHAYKNAGLLPSREKWDQSSETVSVLGHGWLLYGRVTGWTVTCGGLHRISSIVHVCFCSLQHNVAFDQKIRRPDAHLSTPTYIIHATTHSQHVHRRQILALFYQLYAHLLFLE